MDNNILHKIYEILDKINARQEAKRMREQSDVIFQTIDRRIEFESQQIQHTFNRIHSGTFNFNSILIGIYLVLTTYPIEEPILDFWYITLPVTNLVLLIWIEIRQIGIHRFATKENDWTNKEREIYGRKIQRQNRFSLCILGSSFICLLILIINLL